jgi:Ca-activated chloride channel family protein
MFPLEEQMKSLRLKNLILRFAPIVLLLTTLSFSAGRQGMDSGLPIAANASQLEASKPPLIRVQSNLVRVPVSVTDASGNPVVDLELEDFRIEEDGRLMVLSSIAKTGITPLELALVMDTSASVQSRFEFEVQSAIRFLTRILKPGDYVGIITIGSHPRLIQPSTDNIEEALHSLNTMVAGRESTALYDTVVMAASLLRQTLSPESRRVQVVISDGEDNSSESHELEDALREIQHADCILYAINPAGPSISTDGQRALQGLAGETGGTAFLPDGPDELEAVFDRIARELDTQYLLEYYSDKRGDASFRKIAVQVPGRPGLRIRSRQGYYSRSGLKITSERTRAADASRSR